MKVKWGNVEMMSRRQGLVASVVVLLLLQCSTTFARNYHAVYVPVGVGETQDATKIAKFGEFHDSYQMCGKRTVDGLSEQFKTSSMEILVTCEPSPDRIIVAEAVTDYGTFTRDLKNECELFTCSDSSYKPESQKLYAITNADDKDSEAQAGLPPNTAWQICSDKEPAYPEKGSSAVLYANEGNCFAMQPASKNLLQAAGSKFRQVPRWLKPGEETFNLRHNYFEGERLENTHHTFFPFVFSQKTALGSLKYQECHTACDSGEVVKLTMKDSAYKTMIYLNGDCESFKVCFGADNFDSDNDVPRCHPQKTISVLVDAGVVVWPDKRRSSVIELKSPHHDAANVLPIEFGYNAEAQYYFGNDHREYVQSDSKGFNKAESQRITVIFPKEECLKKDAGIFSKYIDVGKTLTSKPVTKGVTYDVTLTPITGPQLEKPAVVAVPDPIVNIAGTTTPAPLRAVPGSVSIAMANQLAETNLQSQGMYATGKWWTWGVYVGFIIGTISTLALGAGIFYAIRRTVFSVWYRGMYKRYGCDVSGTTAGLTGVGFGNTVTGDVTVAATTGGTTATTGATGTTSSVVETKTSASTLAM